MRFMRASARSISGLACSILLSWTALASRASAEGCEFGPDELCAVVAGMGGSLVTPQVIPEFRPQGYLHLYYDNIDVGPAQQLAPERVARQPFVKFNLSNVEQVGPPYVLLAIDPDASAVHTSQSCALHWMLTDVYFDPESNLMSSGFVSAQYARPNPPEGPLHHRYVFLLYQQPLLFLPPVFSPTMTGARLHFNLLAFTQDYGLTSPVGANFIKSFWTGIAIPEDEQTAIDKDKQTQQITIKAHANPLIAALIGSVMGLLYGAGS